MTVCNIKKQRWLLIGENKDTRRNNIIILKLHKLDIQVLCKM